MKNYIYTNHNTKTAVVIQAENISEADALYEKDTGLNPIKASYVGCQVVNIDPIKDMIDNQEL